MHRFGSLQTVLTVLLTLPLSAHVGEGQKVASADVQSGAPRLLTNVSTSDPELVLIQLRGTPLARRHGTLTAARQALAAQRQRVAATVVRLAAQARRRALAQSEVITHEYSVVFHGVAARVPVTVQAQVRSLPDVQAVYPDAEVHAMDAPSVSRIQAPAFWSTYSYRGGGKVIAIIDTGVDYTHPDLGGCFGAGCKVIGGYDFVNRDHDPQDDNGHGTHVASTAAGNSATVPGVAPDASILAYKVLDATGSGSDSLAIAGVERAVDPNKDGNTADHVDVINLSLGGAGDANDPVSQAVDNATAAGVLVVASAGNDGRSFFTINSPGAAHTALTVGATDENDQVTDFSSRGPTTSIYGLKPEIVAPGVNVCGARAADNTLGETCVDDTHIQLSGTSMAAPQVAGAAALLRGVLPTLTPAEVKSLLVQNSVDLGYAAFMQGAGRLDVAAAGNARTVATPAAVSFGRDDLSLSTWTATQLLTVRNIDSGPRSYTLSTGPLQTGISATLTPSNVTLELGAATTVPFDLAVDNTVAPDRIVAPYAYDSVVLITSGSQQQRVPFAFLKTPVVLFLNQLKLKWVKGDFPDVVATLLIRGLFDATGLRTNYFASLASALQGGFMVGVTVSAVAAPDQMVFPGEQCSMSRRAIHCRGSSGEIVHVRQSAQNLFSVKISARNRPIPFKEVAGGAAVVDLVLTVGGLDLHDKIRCSLAFRGGRFQMNCRD